MVLKYPNGYDDEFINTIKMIIDIIRDRGDEILSSDAVENSINNWLSANDFKPKDSAATFTELPSSPELKEIRGVIDENKVYTWNGEKWVVLNNINFDGLESVRRSSNVSLTDLWQPPTQPDIHSHFSGGDAYAQHIYSEWLGLYETLYTSNTGYMDKTLKPNVYEDRYEYPIYTFTPESGYSKTIILGSGMHGGEKVMVVSLYRFLERLCNGWKGDAHLTYIRNNIRLVVIPFQNPFGIAYNTRKQGYPGTDINRNFDYKWTESGSTNPESGNYKGTAPFSTPEATYIKEILEEYSEAIAYIDFHNKSSVPLGSGYSTTSYVPSKQPFETIYLKSLKEALNPPGDNYEVMAFDEATAYNYAVGNFQMHSFNPEYLPGHNYAGNSSADMTFALKWLGNIIIRFALLSTKVGKLESSEPRIDLSSVNRTTATAYPIAVSNDGGIGSSRYSNIPQLQRDFYPSERGYYKFTYTITYSSDDPTTLVWFTPKVFQTGDDTADFKSDTDISVFANLFEVYEKGATDRNVVVLKAILPVENSDFYSYARSQIWAYTTAGNASILRFKCEAEFVPSNRMDRVNLVTY